jgi:3-phenylpropionate/trans-cinnamate dioxygenase ferredoxin reductase component
LVTASRIVVVGAGIAGLRTAEALRSEGFDGELVMIGDEVHPPYSRPPLSKDLLAGRHSPEDIALKPVRDLGNISWRLGATVVAATLANREVLLEDASTIAYDGLVIATGVRSRRLDLPGPVAGRHALRSLTDAMTLRPLLGPDRRVVVIGAGFIGCEVAATARLLGCEVTVVAPEAVPMERPLGHALGGELRRRHEDRGVQFRLQHTINSVHGDEAVTAVELATGEVLPCDVMLEAVGSIPNVEWLRHNDISLVDGVVCDSHLEVEGHEQVVAVGDVAHFPHAMFGGVTARVEHWNVPTETARQAAATLAARLAGRPLDNEPFFMLPVFWTHQFDTRLQSFGLPGLGAGDIRVLSGSLDGGVVMGYFSQDRLVGIVGTTGPKELLPYRAQLLQA